jgi:hypothetical protein
LYNNVIFLVVIIIVLTVAWIAVNINIRTRKKSAADIKKVSMSGYIAFLKSFQAAEEEENKGDLQSARSHFQKALELLQNEELQDDLIKETIAEVEERIAALEKKD